MNDWKYNPDNYNPDGYELIAPGNYRVRIEDCEEKLTQTGKDMYKLTLSVSGYSAHVWYNLVFDSTDERMRKMTDQKLGSIFDSFDIPKGSLSPTDWKGRTGGARIKNSLYNGEMRAEVSYFLKRKKVDELPAWREGNTGTSNPPTSTASDFNAQALEFGQSFSDNAEDKIKY